MYGFQFKETHVSLQECLRKQTLEHLGEASAHQRQKHSGHHDMISRLGHASDLSPAHNGHAARNVSDRHLVAVLLHLDFLELDELGATSLQVQPASRLVHSAIIRGTIVNRRKGQRVDRLIGLRATAIAGIGGHHHHGLDLRAAGHDATDCDQFANVLGLHLANGVRLLRGQGFEAHLAREIRYLNKN